MPKFIEYALKDSVATLGREQLICNVVYQSEDDVREGVKYLSRSASSIGWANKDREMGTW